MARTRLYRNGNLVSEDVPVAELVSRASEPDTVVWLDLCQPDESDLSAVRDELGLHELAIEDAVTEHQRPKLDCYDAHSFLIVYAAALGEDDDSLRVHELAVFIAERVLVTVRKDPAFDIEAVVRRWDSAAGREHCGVAFLVHGLLDHVVDGYFEATQQLGDRIEVLEDNVFADRPDHTALQRRSLNLRKSLVRLRRVVVPMREVVASLRRHDVGLVDASMAPYFDDVHDHVLRAVEWTESLRELITTVRETQINLQGYELNTIMKKLTGWAAIIAVPTAVTGFYGQNVPYPGADSPTGFWVSTAVILASSLGLWALLRRRGWL